MKCCNHNCNQGRDCPDRPFDWQDRVVMAGSLITGVVCLFILIWGR